MAKAKKRRSREEWTGLIAAWKRSGITQAEFCQREGLSRRTLGWWRWRLEREAAPPPPTKAEFVEVQVVEPEPRTEQIRDFDVLVAGLVVRVPAGFDEEALSRLVRVLECRPC